VPGYRFLAALLLLFVASPGTAGAIPVFAHRYGVTCQACHTIVPRLNGFGEAFRDAGFRWPAAVSVTPPEIPIAMKSQLAYTSATDPGGLPKATVDEIEFLLMGAAGKHLDYRVEQYAVDGGVAGKTRDAFVEYNSDPLSAWRGITRPVLTVAGGQFTLPLPNDPETQRPTLNHYAVFDQTVGGNPFNFFDDRIGLNVGVATRVAELNVIAAKGHDPQSGLPTSGTDGMATLRIGTPELSLYGYQYVGSRAFGPTPDAFTRRGFALKSTVGRARTTLLFQTGDDRSSDGFGTHAHSSGGYLQEEWAFTPRLIGAARYDASSTPDAFLRSTTVSLNYRVLRNARFTVEGVLGSHPSVNRTLNLGLLFAY
jgi:hypothetical protein